MSKFLTMLMLVLSVTAIANACDPNEECTRHIGSYPCPTWKQPGRTCPAYANDPVCDARKLACRTQCSNTNKDADKYILNAQTEIRNAQNLIATTERMKVLNQTALLMEQMDNEKILKLWQASKVSMVELDIMLKSQETIKTFVQTIQEQSKTGLESKALILEKINEYSAKGDIYIVWFLKSLLLAREQNEALDLQLKTVDVSEPIVQLKDVFNKQFIELNSLLDRSFEKINSKEATLKTLDSIIKENSAKITHQSEEIKRQEARKCSTIL